MSEDYIGIDLGASYSCVSVSNRSGEIEVIADEQGSRTTPSWVAFTETDIIVGEAAVSQAPSNIANTIFDIKCLIGQKFSDPEFQKKVAQYPFKVLAGDNDAPVVEVTLKGETKQFTIEELISLIFKKMKKSAESYIGCTVHKTVIGVPVLFSESARATVRKAAELAGFKKTCFVNECTAAAMAYNLDLAEETKSPKTVVVVDFGGACLNVAAVRADQGLLTHLGSVTDDTISGSKVDDLLLQHFAKEFERKNKGIKLLDGSAERAMQKLRNSSEAAKRVLASGQQAKIELDAFHGGKDFFTNISKARFEAMTGSTARTCVSVVKSLLEKVGLTNGTVDQVLCIGGSTKLTKVRQALNDFFGASKVLDTVNQDEAVVIGIALEASVLQQYKEGEMKENQTIPASSVTVGVEVSGGLVYPLIRRGTALPASATKTFLNSEDGQTSVAVTLVQGERVRASDNQHIGSFLVSGIAAKPRGESKVEVMFSMAADGSLNVSAKEMGSGASNELKVSQSKDAPSAAALQKSNDDAMANAEGDRQLANEVFAKQLESLNIGGDAEEAESDEDEGDEGDSEEESSDAELDLDDDLE